MKEVNVFMYFWNATFGDESLITFLCLFLFIFDFKNRGIIDWEMHVMMLEPDQEFKYL